MSRCPDSSDLDEKVVALGWPDLGLSVTFRA